MRPTTKIAPDSDPPVILIALLLYPDSAWSVTHGPTVADHNGGADTSVLYALAPISTREKVLDSLQLLGSSSVLKAQEPCLVQH